MNPGTPICFNNPNGSFGVIVNPHDYDDGFYVRYNYGKDVSGKYITSLASVSRRDISVIDPNLYKEYINCLAWSDEQKPIRQKILTKLSATGIKQHVG